MSKKSVLILIPARFASTRFPGKPLTLIAGKTMIARVLENCKMTPQDLARAVARRLRAGQVSLNSPDWDTFAPFGGYKQSGNGREYADWGIHDFCEVKSIVGYGDA